MIFLPAGRAYGARTGGRENGRLEPDRQAACIATVLGAFEDAKPA
jgi:hypothetical protein